MFCCWYPQSADIVTPTGSPSTLRISKKPKIFPKSSPRPIQQQSRIDLKTYVSELDTHPKLANITRADSMTITDAQLTVMRDLTAKNLTQKE